MKEVQATEINLLEGLSEQELSLRPYCRVCGWRKGGLGSWNGKACKCGDYSPTFKDLFTPSPEK